MWKIKIYFNIIGIFLFYYLNFSCASHSSRNVVRYRVEDLKTNIPKKFGQISPAETGRSADFPFQLFSIKGTARSHVEVRSGPGSNFQLEDFVLAYDTPVVILSEYNVWRKILVLSNQRTGWVHYRLLYPQKYEQPVRVNLISFPYVTARKEIRYLREFPSLEKKEVLIPKGSGFVVLKSENGFYLVWLEQTSSVAWIPNTDLM